MSQQINISNPVFIIKTCPLGHDCKRDSAKSLKNKCHCHRFQGNRMISIKRFDPAPSCSISLIDNCAIVFFLLVVHIFIFVFFYLCHCLRTVFCKGCFVLFYFFQSIIFFRSRVVAGQAPWVERIRDDMLKLKGNKKIKW